LPALIKALPRLDNQGQAGTVLEGLRLTLQLELGQGGRCGKRACRSERRSEGSRVHSGSEERHLLFYFFYSLYFSESLPWELKVV